MEISARTRAWLSVAWLVAVASVLGWSEFGPTAESTSLAVGGFLLGLGFAVTSVLLRHQPGQRGNANLFVALTAAWVAGSVGTLGLGVLTQPLLWLGSFTQVLAAAAFLRYPEDRFERIDRIFLCLSGAALGFIGGARLLTSTPDTWERHMNGVPWLTLWPNPDLYATFTAARHAVWAAAGGALLVLLWRRWRRMGLLERRTLAPVLIIASATTLFTMTKFVEPWLSPGFATVGAEVRAYAAAGVAVAFALSALQMRLARTVVADLVADLAESPSAANVLAALRHRLGDAHLEIWYWVPNIAGYVDGEGAPRDKTLDAGPRHMLRDVTDSDGDPLAVVLIDSSLRRHSKLVDAALAVSRFALENARLQAELRQQLLVVSQTRRRLLHSGLEQRRRLERDLHDGAQQRLLGIGMRLGALEARSDDARVARTVHTVRDELALALEELRHLAHGLYPAILTQSGLGPALEAVAERLPVPIHLRVEAKRWRPDVESAAYLIACEAFTNTVKHAGTCTVHLTAHERNGELVIDIADNGAGIANLHPATALAGIRDRVSSMDGHLNVISSPGMGTRVVAVLPCE